MNVDFFEDIVEKQAARMVNGHAVDAQTASAVLSVRNNLNEEMRSRFMAMPLEHILQFTRSHVSEEPTQILSIKHYLKETEAQSEPESMVEIAEPSEPDTTEQAPQEIAEPIIEEIKEIPKPKKKRVTETINPSVKLLCETLVKKDDSALQLIREALTNTVDVLAETQKANARIVESLTHQLDGLHKKMQEPSPLLEAHSENINQLFELNLQVIKNMESLIETVDRITQASVEKVDRTTTALLERVDQITSALVEKVELLSSTRPVVNVPAPQVTIAMQEKRTVVKNVERDNRGFITKVTEEEAPDKPKLNKSAH